MNKSIFVFLLLINLHAVIQAQPTLQHDLDFKDLAKSWDEAIPLGNGMVGALVWQKDNHVRFSLDRADLWDQRPMKGLHRPEFSFKWVQEQVAKKDYKIVQDYFDKPYDHEPAPSKISGGALEFNSENWGKVASVHLFINNAICKVKWENGLELTTFVHATKPLGWFKLEHFNGEFNPNLIAPKYQRNDIPFDSLKSNDVAKLGYEQGKINKSGNTITYHQNGWNGFKYDITVAWKYINKTTIEGVWSISSNYKKENIPAETIVKNTLANSFKTDSLTHINWWAAFWSKSNLHVPDKVLEKQYYLEMYKFGALARLGAPPIALQGVWTADNNKLPPWKGDYHHDLNTELSYWPAYSGNHLDGALSFLDHLDENKPNYKRYAKLYFGTDGIAVPGVTTLDGTEMGGWIQYALSPTVSAWLAQHYYLQWKYTMDEKFLRTRAYPWVSGVAKHLEEITFINKNGFRQLPISSSPEINNNDITAWFPNNTNYDLALMKFAFTAAIEMGDALKLDNDVAHYKKILSQFDGFALTKNNEMMFAANHPYAESHRHFSNALAIHPLGLIKWEDGEKERSIIKNTLHLIDSIGPAAWCGYSYAWMCNMQARAKNGDAAAKNLQIFAKAFCSPNSFHLNGDQTKSGYSGFTYKPFTLEGNFAFAAGLQEMLLQSYAGFIEIFPAVPQSWKNISFNQLRAEGAFLISAVKENGQVISVKIKSEKGGKAILKLPFKTYLIGNQKLVKIGKKDNGFLELNFQQGGEIDLKNGYE